MLKERIDKIFFYAFLASATLSIRKVLYFRKIGDSFNEYAAVYIYLSDILLFLALITWFIYILKHKKEYKSIVKAIKLINVPRGTLSVEKLFSLIKAHVIHRQILYIVAAFIALAFASIMWSNDRNVALFRAIKLVEYALLCWYLIENVPRGTFFKRLLWISISIGVVQSLIGIWQFLVQHSVGLFILKESVISSNGDAVAKVIFEGEKFIRSYGLFPHPNVFAGYLLFSIILTVMSLKMFHVEQKQEKCSTWNKILALKLPFCDQDVPRGTIIIKIALILQIIALLLTFSKSAIGGLIIAIVYILYINVPRGTFLQSLNGFRYLFSRKFLLVCLILFSLLILIRPNIPSLLTRSIHDRNVYINVSRGTIMDNPLLGVGVGQFVMDMANDYNFPDWQYQPVHNVFLLLLSENGILGVILIVSLFVKMFHVEHLRQKNYANRLIIERYLIAITLGLAFIALWDHYLWDIQQGQILLVVSLVLVISRRKMLY